MAAVGELSKLETNAVYPETLKSYIDAVKAPNAWCEIHNLSVEEYQSNKLERILLEYADDCINEGKTPDMGNTLLSAVKALYPRYSRTGDLTLPRFSRASQGWNKLMP